MTISFLFFQGSCVLHQEVEFLIGNSVNEKSTVEEYVEMYLNAKCRGTSYILVQMTKPTSLDFILADPVDIDYFLPDERACNLQIKDISRGKSKKNPEFDVDLVNPNNPDKLYCCSLKVYGDRMYINEPLRDAFSHVPEDFDWHQELIDYRERDNGKKE